VDNLLDLDHQKHVTLSWTLNARSVIETFERNTSSLDDRLKAMEAAAALSYPVRAVIMPIIAIPDWEAIYRDFLSDLLSRVQLQRITLGSICSYPQAMRLTEQKLGRDNPIAHLLDRRQNRMPDGRLRFPKGLREEAYRHLIKTIRRRDANVEIGLCLEEPSVFKSLDLAGSVGRCNCVW
jgi:spore photoproduct lyase